jgi:hypothetical protein
MRYFWLLNGSLQKLFDFQYHPGPKNLPDYNNKHHHHPDLGSHHTEVRPYYVHMPNSPRYLLPAANLSILQGCVNLDKDTNYIRKYPLPKLEVDKCRYTRTTYMCNPYRLLAAAAAAAAAARTTDVSSHQAHNLLVHQLILN